MVIDAIIAAAVQIVVSVLIIKYNSGMSFTEMWMELYGEPANDERQQPTGILREDPCC
jgi:hypothetical protein